MRQGKMIRAKRTRGTYSVDGFASLLLALSLRLSLLTLSLRGFLGI
jgi:hypothetical protein